MKKRIIAMLMAVMILTGLFSGFSVSAVGGKCGDNAYWSISGNVLTITGKGAIYDYTAPAQTPFDNPPWIPYSDNVNTVVVSKGITRIGRENFAVWPEYISITLPDGLLEIGEAAFAENTFKKITIPNSVTKIGWCAFADNNELEEVILSKNLKEIGSHAFVGCNNLKKITIPAGVTKIGEHALGYWGTYFPGHCGGCGHVADPKFHDDPYRIGLTIYCEKGSAAHKYAVSEQMNFRFTNVCEKFTDVLKTDWYHKNGAIHYCVDKKLFSGTSATTFGPTKNMTRAMFVTVLGRLHGQSVNHKVTTAFIDVKKNQYYTGYVKWAYENEIVAGTSKRKFEPNANITREQICAMMLRYSNYAGIRIKQFYKVITFSDADRISAWASDAVRACQQGGLVTGEKVGSSYRFRPKGSASRAEVATIMMNYSKTYK